MSKYTQDGESLTLESLLKQNNLSEAQVSQKIEESDLIKLAKCFGKLDVEDYIYQELFELQAKQVENLRASSEPVEMLLRYWIKNNVTFETLLKILVQKKKGTVARKVCKYAAQRLPIQEYFPECTWNLDTNEYTRPGSILLLGVCLALYTYGVYTKNTQAPQINANSFTVGEHEHLFHWEDNGFTIYFPKDSVEPQTTCNIHVQYSLSGQYQFPKNHDLVSAVFWIQLSSTCKFEKNVTVQIQHCASRGQRDKLRFVRTLGNSNQLPPYNFQALEEGIFSNTSSFGTLNVTRFSGLAITSHGPAERLYTAKLFYIGTTLESWFIHLAITWDTDVHNKVSLRRLSIPENV